MEKQTVPIKARAVRRAAAEKAKVRARARRMDTARYLWRRGEDGELVWFRDIPDDRTVGILARSPKACACSACQRPRYDRAVANREWRAA